MFSCNIADDGQGFVVTTPTVPRILWNNAPKVQDKIKGTDASKRAHGIVNTALANDETKRKKTINFRLPSQAVPAKCPSTTPLPLTINNYHFNEGKKDDFDLEATVVKLSKKWKFNGQERQAIYIFAMYEAVIDGTSESIRVTKKLNADPLSALFVGTLKFDDSDEEDKDPNAIDIDF